MNSDNRHKRCAGPNDKDGRSNKERFGVDFQLNREKKKIEYKDENFVFRFKSKINLSTFTNRSLTKKKDYSSMPNPILSRRYCSFRQDHNQPSIKSTPK